MQTRTVIFMGPQGSGKGTQLANVREYFDTRNEHGSVFQTGDMYRALQKEDTFVAGRVRETLDRGMLQPLALTVALWGREFIEHSNPGAHHLIDGFPRRLAEAKLLHEMLEFCERLPADVVFLDVDDASVIERMKGRGRADDTEAAIAKRMDFYKKHTAPIIPYYESNDAYTVHRIDASASLEDVTAAVFRALDLS